ncbi:MAG TPA: YceI family protein [Candidatus Limnocylindrales bacterium]|nr:YceI family protein [Candidatus Limnocylindrales bacterium]
MTTPTTGPSRRTPLLAIAAVVLLIAAGAGLWYLFLRPAGPAPVSLGSSPAATESATQGAVAETSPDPTDDPASADPSAGASSGSGSGDGIAGMWTVDPSVGSFDDFSGSFVGYRVREELASVGATEAVGRTPDVTGSMTVDGTTITAADFTADVTTLRSDEGNRDRQLRRQGLETGTYPTATFTLTKPIELESAPADGETVEATATGDLTIHGTTKSVEIPVQAKLENGVVTVVGSLPILFSDYGMSKPQAMIVLSVEDNGTMEFQLRFTRS